MNIGDYYLRVAEAADVLQVSERQVQRRIQAGTLPALMIGRVCRVERAALFADAPAPPPTLPPTVSLQMLVELFHIPAGALLAHSVALGLRRAGDGWYSTDRAVARFIIDHSTGDETD